MVQKGENPSVQSEDLRVFENIGILIGFSLKSGKNIGFFTYRC